ncbi:MAG: TonB-dependent receptor domain-containing protein [Rhodothalassiaceae bacterium]
MEEVEEMVVTGSRIQRADLTSNSPVTILGEEEFVFTNTVDGESLLRDLPQTQAATTSVVNNGNAGVATLDLRDLGEVRTLVLLEGRRLLSFDSGGVVDVNQIPVALVERVDTLTGGASATYGSDAIAGVVNYVLTDDFEGVELDGTFQIDEFGDGEQYQTSITVGGNFADGRGNAVITAQYTDRNGIFQSQRPFSEEAFGIGSFGDEELTPLGSATDLDGTFNLPGGGGLVDFEDDGTLTPQTDTFNFNPFNYLQVPNQRWNIFGKGQYEYVNGHEVYAQGHFFNSRVDAILAPSGTFFNAFEVGVGPANANPFLTAQNLAILANPDAIPAINAANAGADGSNPLCAGSLTDAAFLTSPTTIANCGDGILGLDTSGDGIDDLGVDLDGDGMLDPNAAVNFGFGRRTVEVGPRTFENETFAFQFVGGFRGELPLGWTYDLHAQFGRSQLSTPTLNGLSSVRTQDSLSAITDEDGNIVCAPGAAAGCVPGDFFGPGDLSEAAADFIGLDSLVELNTNQTIVNGFIQGDFEALGIKSPFATSTPGFVFGFEFREEEAESFPDDNLQNGTVVGVGSVQPIDGRFDVIEGFVEVIAPLVQDQPFIYDLKAELAARVSRYSTIGTVATYKLGGEYSPIPDIRLRGLFQRAVRAPNIGELFTPQTPGVAPVTTDPCDQDNLTSAVAAANPELAQLCIATGVPPAAVGFVTPPIVGQAGGIFGGNADLEEETADTFTVGAVIQPEFLPGFALTVDYYSISVTDVITPFGGSGQNVLNNCYFVVQDAASDFCQAIVRDPLTGGLNGNDDIGIQLFLANAAELSTRGFDFGMRYGFDVADFVGQDLGSIDINLNSVFILEQDFTADEVSPTVECEGLYGNTCGEPNPRYRQNLRVTWNYGPASVSTRWRFISRTRFDDFVLSGFDPDSGIAVNEIGSQNYVDLTGVLQVLDFAEIRGGILNLFDNDPPILGTGAGLTADNNANTFPGTYDAIGRRYFVGLTIRL